MENRKIILGFYVTCSMVLWFLSRAVIEWSFLKFYQLRRIPGAVGLREGLPVLLGVGLFLILYNHARVGAFLDDVVQEIRKVTWPARQDVVKSTTVVVIAIAMASLLLAGFDLFWGEVVGYLLHVKLT